MAQLPIPAFSFVTGETIRGPFTLPTDIHSLSLSLDMTNFVPSFDFHGELSKDGGQSWQEFVFFDVTKIATVDKQGNPIDVSNVNVFNRQFGTPVPAGTRVRLRIVSTSAWNSSGGTLVVS